MEKLKYNIYIRKGDISDLEVIVANNIKMAQETENKLLNKSCIYNGVDELLNNSNLGWYYVAVIDKHIAGQLMITREWSDWRNGYFWWIQSVYVIKKYRRIGVYSILHSYVDEQAKIMGAVGLRLYVDSKNKSAHTVYENLGMKTTNYLLYENTWSK